MPGLSKESLQRAILHLTSLGDTDIFPPPFEFKFYEFERDSLVDLLKDLNTGSHTPTSAFECLCPKGNLSFRIAHQLFPIDTLLYTAAVIQIAPALSEMKSGAEDAAFAYQFIEENDNPRLFLASSSYHDWLCHLKEVFSGGSSFDDLLYVIETDISDFYSRIYFHRLEHVFDDCGAPNQVRRIIEKIIKATRARQSYGLPVGSSASRILAEALLADTDKMISDGAVHYSRYVDDFRIVVKHQAEVHSTLCKLAEHLMLTEGLSLNASKTRSYTTQDGVKLIDAKLSDVFNDEELVRLNQYIRAAYDDEDVSVEDIEDVDAAELTRKLSEVSRRTPVDYTALRVILKALRAVEIEDPIGFVNETIDLLYHLPRDYCILIGGIAQRSTSRASEISEILVRAIKEAPFRDMALSRIWVAHLFVTQAVPINNDLRTQMNLTRTPVERRQDLLLLGLLRDRSFFRSQKTKFDEANAWEKPALMFGASCLSKSEYETWLDTIKAHLSDPARDLYRKWLVDNQENLYDLIKVDFRIKTRSEKIAELFGPLDPESALGKLFASPAKPEDPEVPF
jgi:hypothetical protein